MIIKDTQLYRDNKTTTLSAKCRLRKIGWDMVYFSVDNVLPGDYIHHDASPFAAALLLPSMRQGENLVIEGSVSAQLYRGMHAIMQEVQKWDIGLQPIKIEAGALVADPPRPQRSASFFSGGVDSFYTYLKHKTDPMEKDRIDNFILVNGFDINQRNTQLWDRALDNIKSIAEADGVELIVVRSNIQGLVEPVLLWDYAHGGCLAAVGLFLRGAFHQVYIPSTHSVAEQIPWGSNFALDGHWSTESTAFVHDGTEATRLEKVLRQIARSPLALGHLRVCFENEPGAYNCGRCDKCLRTMMNLYVAGVLEQSGTFPHRIDPALVLPAHGRPYREAAERVTYLEEHHRRRKDQILEITSSREMTAWEVALEVWGERGHVYERRLALQEGLAHLQSLAVEGRLEKLATSERVTWRHS